MNVVYITGNAHKAKYFSKMVGLDIPHQKIDIDELQTMDIDELMTHKVKGAYAFLQTPVIVEDTFVTLTGMNGLPGPYIKWFLESLGSEGICTLATAFDPKKRRVVVGATIAYYDGKKIELFKSQLEGTIAQRALGDTGFGWNPIFIPNGQLLTLGQMDEATFEHYYRQIKPWDQLRTFLDNL